MQMPLSVSEGHFLRESFPYRSGPDVLLLLLMYGDMLQQFLITALGTLLCVLSSLGTH